MLVEKVRGKFIEYEVCMRVCGAADGSKQHTRLQKTTQHQHSPRHSHPPPSLSLSLLHTLSQVDKKAGKAKELVVEYGSKAYEQAKTSQLAAKASEAAAQGLEKASAAYEQVAANPAVQQIAVKGGGAREPSACKGRRAVGQGARRVARPRAQRHRLERGARARRLKEKMVEE